MIYNPSMKFKIDKRVLDKFDDVVEVVPIIRGFDARKNGDLARQRLRSAEVEVRERFKDTDWRQLPEFKPYLTTFGNFGAKESWLPSHAALLTRVLEGKDLPDINPVVNFYNAYSLRYLIPFGGENLSQVYGEIRLSIAEGGEEWWAIGADKNQPAITGELIWRDDAGVTCRGWNWRQCDRTKLTEETTNGYFVMDGFENNRERLEEVATKFVVEFVKLFGGQGQILVLDKEGSELEIDFESKKIVVGSNGQKSKKVEERRYYFLVKEVSEYIKGKDPTFVTTIDHPAVEKFGDLAVRGDVEVTGMEAVERVDKIAGFTNIWLKNEVLIDEAQKILSGDYKNELMKIEKGKKIMVEYAHPNTHKELHVGHMRTLITGEAVARLFESLGATVFRANYQGDIGPHVAKAIWGIKKLLSESGESVADWEKKTSAQKAHFLGKSYALGCVDNENEESKKLIDEINQKLYANDPSIAEIYSTTRRWSLEYYQEFYERFYTKFDQLFFESEIAADGKSVVKKNLGRIFENGEGGAIVFDGVKYGLHKRVFITGMGTVTYEGKEMGLAYAQKKAFEYDRNIHVVANEQAGYFQVVIKAMELVDPWFVDRQYHLSMGMVTLADRKMSSRTGDVITVDSLLDEVKNAVSELMKKGEMKSGEVAEAITIGAVKYSVLRSSPTQNSVFDIKKSVNLDGNSGPYLQYTYARCLSVIGKATIQEESGNVFDENEVGLLRYFYQFKEKIAEAGERLNPAVLAEYLANLARKYNEFYGKCRIIGEPEEAKRLFLTKVTATVLHDGLNILGIRTVERM